MSTSFSGTAWLCPAVTVVLGGIALCHLKSPGRAGRKVVCLAGLWGGAYLLLSLPLSWGLLLCLLSCFLTYTYLSGQELLPVDQKAVLITGKWTALQSSLRAESGTGFAVAGLFQVSFEEKLLGTE